MADLKIRINDDKLAHGMAKQELINTSKSFKFKFDRLLQGAKNFKKFEDALRKDMRSHIITSVCTSIKKIGSRSKGYALIAHPTDIEIIILRINYDAKSNKPCSLDDVAISISKHVFARMAQRFLHKMDLFMMLQELLPHILAIMNSKLPNACGAGHILIGETLDDESNSIQIKTYFSADMARQPMLIVNANDQNVRAFS